jgi:ubiquitin-protein ligase
MWSTQRSVLSHQASAKAQSTAVKRLLKDVRALAECKPPPVGIAAQPLEKDLFEWHANLKGPKGTPYEGGIFHLILKFPHTYPYDPPTCTVSTKLPHPNVHNSSVCLDMLQPGSEEIYSGWSTAYSVLSILIQLQAFLFEVPATGLEWTQEHRQAKEAANNFSCSGCSHKPFRVWPEFPNLDQETFVIMKSDVDIAKEELICFHSKRNYTDDTLGFGLSFNRSIQ